MAKSFELPNIDALMAPYKALNELAMANAEKLISVQSANYVKYSNMALASLKEAAVVTNVEKSKAYFKKQADLTRQVTEDLGSDVNVVAEMGNAYVAELQSVLVSSAKVA